jgi:hypothetical protein
MFTFLKFYLHERKQMKASLNTALIWYILSGARRIFESGGGDKNFDVEKQVGHEGTVTPNENFGF